MHGQPCVTPNVRSTSVQLPTSGQRPADDWTTSRACLASIPSTHECICSPFFSEVVPGLPRRAVLPLVPWSSRAQLSRPLSLVGSRLSLSLLSHVWSPDVGMSPPRLCSRFGGEVTGTTAHRPTVLSPTAHRPPSYHPAGTSVRPTCSYLWKTPPRRAAPMGKPRNVRLGSPPHLERSITSRNGSRHEVITGVITKPSRSRQSRHGLWSRHGVIM